MTLTRDWQFDLAGVGFGYGESVSLGKFERGGFSVRDQDQPSVDEDAIIFGRDHKTPDAWNFTLYTDLSDLTNALNTVEALENLWDASGTRDTPQAVLPLRYRINGRIRRIYGRPRRFSATPQSVAQQGKIGIVADFLPAHTGTFDDSSNDQTFAVGTATFGPSGVTFPVTFPYLWGGTTGSPQTRTLTVAGTQRTFAIATITAGSGILTNPYLVIDGTTLKLSGSLSPGDSVVLNSNPWETGIYRTDGTTSSLVLDAISVLSTLRLDPGPHTITFGGTDGTGSAHATVGARAHYASM
jgi:hypothetical protein